MIDIFKKSIIYLLCIMFAMSNVTAFAEEKAEEEKDIINIEERIKSAEENGHRYAYIIPGNGDISMVNGIVGTNRWNSSQMAEKMVLYDWKPVTHHDKLAIECTASEQSNIFASFSGKYWDEKPISRRLAITVEYIDIYDSSFDVWSSFDFPKLESPQSIPFTAVVTEGSNEWKTVTFYVEGNAGTSMRLRTPTIQPLGGIYKTPIGNIFIEEDLGEYPLTFDADNGYAGRIYSFGDSEKMTVSYDNTLNSKVSADVSYNIKDYEGKIVNSGKLAPVSLDIKESGNQEILTGVTQRGTYTLELIADLEEENGNKHRFSKNLNFSIMDTIEEGEERNPLAGFCSGLSANQYHGGYAGAEQVTRIPVSKVRLDGMGAAEVETSKGVYKDPVLSDRQYFNENGIGVYVIAMNLQSWYNGGRANNIYPNTKEAHEGYADYAAYIASLPYVDTIELFNEWNHSGFSPLDQSADGYLEYCKVAYPAIKAAAAEQGKEITVLAGGTAGFSVNWLERFIALGGLSYCDGFSYHPYQYKDFNYKSFKNQTEQVKDWMMKYHGSLKPIHLTEMGMSEANDEATTNAGYTHWNKMRSLPAMYIMAQHYDVYETIYYYAKHTTGENINYREPGFGLYKYTGDLSGNRLTAQDAAVTFAAYLDKLTGTEPGRKIEDEECTKLAYEFIKKDGTNIAALWTSTQHDTIALKLGTNSINVYDQFGNLKTTLFSPDGCYDFGLTDEIIYIEGQFSTFEEAESGITLSHGVVSGLMGDAVSFEVSDREGRALRAELDFDPDVFTFGEERDFKDGKLSLNASLKDGITGRYHIGVKIFDENQNVIYYARLAIDIGTEMIDVGIDTVQNSPNDSTHWAVAATVKNISSTKTLNGTITVTEPKEYVGSVRSFSELLPGEERMIKVNLPMMVVKRPQEMTVNVTLDNGVSKDYTLKLDFTSANKATDKIKIDGKVDFGEWNSTLLAEDRADKYYTLISGTYRAGIEDLSVRHKIMWDEDNFYMMAKVRDNIHYSEQQDLSMMWKDDGIQFGILKNNKETLDAQSLAFTELCISDNPSGAKVYRHSSASGRPAGELTNLEVKILRDGGYTIYEMRIPWTELLADEHKAKEGDEYAFSFLVNDNDGAGRKGFMYYNDGIGTNKTPSLFGKLRLN